MALGIGDAYGLGDTSLTVAGGTAFLTSGRRLDEMLCDTGLRCAARVKAARGKASQGKASRGAINACVDKRKPEMLAAMRRLREYSR